MLFLLYLYYFLDNATTWSNAYLLSISIGATLNVPVLAKIASYIQHRLAGYNYCDDEKRDNALEHEGINNE
jgi:ABC-type nickel/cobalt efflux system permease component RcnA